MTENAIFVLISVPVPRMKLERHTSQDNADENDVLRSKGPNFSKLGELALDPRRNMPDIEAEVSFVSTIGTAW